MNMTDKELIINTYCEDGTITHNTICSHDPMWDSVYKAIPNYLFHHNSSITPVIAIREMKPSNIPYFWHPIHNIFAKEKCDMVDIRVWSKLDKHANHIVRGMATLSINNGDVLSGYMIWFKHCTVNSYDDTMYDMIYRVSKILAAQHSDDISVYEKRTHLKPSHKIHHIRNMIKSILTRRNKK